MTGEQWIDKKYDEILGRVEGGYFFGKQVDVNDPKQVALAFYYLGQYELNAQTHNELQLFRDL